MTDVQVPHFSLPFRIVDGTAAVTEQDSFDEIRDCAETIARCPQGFRVEAPDFGIPDVTFNSQDAVSVVVTAAIEEHEPRARFLGDDALVQLVRNVTVQLDTGGES